ncbi:MAG: 3-dehydroquinate synthase [Thermodesulforhabdaceae bacterium]
MEISVNIKREGDYSYKIECEQGLRKKIRNKLKELAPGKKMFWICDWEVTKRWAKDFFWEDDEVIEWEAREDLKNLSSIEALARELVRRGADRTSLLVAVGGGVTGDVVGFLASVYMRGVPFVQVPTTLVAQVDSSIGGKTGVDLPEGKNLVGTFYQPLWVAIDPEFLVTLPERVFSQGMAEVIKTAWIGDPELIKLLEEGNDQAVKSRDLAVLENVVSRCARIKANIVMADERESGLRRVLNLGHTFGHAIEKVSGYSIPHGDAVAIGCVCAAHLGVLLKKVSDDVPVRMASLFSKYDLPVKIPKLFRFEDIMEALWADKKKTGQKLTFVIPLEPGQVELYTTRDFSLVEKTVLLNY